MSGLLNILTESVNEVPRIEFPNLFDKSIIVNRVAFNLFGVDIYWYGVIIAVGVILAFIYAMHKCKQFGLIPDHVFDVAFVAIIFGFIGARAYYCIFIDTDINFFDLRHGGLAIYGGIIAAAIAAAITCVIHKVNLPAMFDVGGLGLLIGQCIGRWGNFVNQEAYGAPTAGSLPWGMTGTTIINDPVVVAKQAELDAAGNGLFALVHPCFLYESLWCLIGFIALHFYSKKLKTFDGEIFLLHDDNLERTSNGWGVAGELPWRDLLKVDAGSWYSGEFKGEPLPLLAEVADRCRQHGMMANIEIKPTTGTGPLTGKVIALAARELWEGMTAPLLSSFEIDALEAAQAAVPELPRGLLLDEWREDWRELTTRLACVSIHLNHKLLDEARVKVLKDAGLHILVYTVNKPQRAAELLRWGVDSICTDAIDLIGPDFSSAD